MPTPLSSHSSIEVLRRTAKRWLKSIVEADPESLARFRRAFPSHAGVPKLREVQQALAREHGFESWAALKQEIEDRQRGIEESIHLLIEKSVNRYGTDPTTQKWGDYERDGPSRGAVAARLLSRHPELAHDSIHTAVVWHMTLRLCAPFSRRAQLSRKTEAPSTDGRRYCASLMRVCLLRRSP